MKALIAVLVLALAGGAAYYFYLKDHPISWTQGPESASGTTAGGSSTGKKDFKEVCARLQADMDHIPVNLHEAHQLPAYAYDTKSKLSSHLQLHAEYVTLTQACDLIIAADQEFADHQEKCGLTPVNSGASPQERARTAYAANPANYQTRQMIWDHQRLQSDGKVRQLLATLENRRL